MSASTAPAPTPAPAPQPPARALAPDLARGTMLLFIAIANISAYLWGHATPMYTSHPVDGTALDRALSTAAILLVDARVYPMFAFLFGYGMVQFARAREARGIPLQAVKGMFWRRHWWLIAFGFVHAALLFSGDILGTYGIAGLALTAALFWGSERAIRITAWVLGIIVAAGAVLSLAIALLVMQLLPAEAAAPFTGADDLFGTTADMLSGTPNYWLAMLIRIGLWLLNAPGAVLGLIVPAAILLGWIAGRHRWLEVRTPRFALPSVAAWGIAIGVVGAIPAALAYLGVSPLLEQIAWGTMAFDQLAGLAGGIGYAALFAHIGMRLQQRASIGVVATAVAALGKRSLSGYLAQSVVFAPLLAAWGAGLGSRINTAAAFAIALGTWLVTVVLAAVLERRGTRGPAEVLLRRLTYADLDRRPADPPHPQFAAPARPQP